VALSAVFVVFAQVLVPILVVVGSAYVLQRGIGLDVGPINRLTIYLLNPALIFTLLVQVRVESSEMVRIVAFMVLLVLAIGAITWLSSRALGLDANWVITCLNRSFAKRLVWLGSCSRKNEPRQSQD
jgi:predicted permease